MDFLKLAQKRKSIRAYLDQKVEREKLINCVQAALLAPSACNSQPWKFIIVDQPEIREKVAQTANNPLLPINQFVQKTPVIVVIVCEPGNLTSRLGGKIKKKQFQYIDLGIAAQHFCLQATSLGLGTCIIGWFDEKKLKKILQIPDNKEVGLLITVGYPENEKKGQRKRKRLEEIFSFNSY